MFTLQQLKMHWHWIWIQLYPIISLNKWAIDFSKTYEIGKIYSFLKTLVTLCAAVNNFIITPLNKVLMFIGNSKNDIHRGCLIY